MDLMAQIDALKKQKLQLELKMLQMEISKQNQKQTASTSSGDEADSVVIGTPEKVVAPERSGKAEPAKPRAVSDDDDSASEATSVSSDSEVTTSTTTTSVSDANQRLRQIRMERMQLESGNGFDEAVNKLYEKTEGVHRQTRRPGTFKEFSRVVGSAMKLQDKLARDKKPNPSGVAQVADILLDNAVANELGDLKKTGKNRTLTKRTIANMAAYATVDAIFKMLNDGRMFENSELRLLAQVLRTDDAMKRYVHPKLASFQDVDMESIADVTKITVCKYIALALVRCAEAQHK
jgi:hypothetical protein